MAPWWLHAKPKKGWKQKSKKLSNGKQLFFAQYNYKNCQLKNSSSNRFLMFHPLCAKYILNVFSRNTTTKHTVQLWFVRYLPVVFKEVCLSVFRLKQNNKTCPHALPQHSNIKQRWNWLTIYSWFKDEKSLPPVKGQLNQRSNFIILY